MDIHRLKVSWNGVQNAAVAIGKVGNPPYNTHTGIIYKESDGNLFMIHLAWHHKLSRESHTKGYICAVPKIREERARSVAALCRLIWKKQQKLQEIPFSLQLSKAISFSPISGSLILPADGLGLNCSNFTIIVFLQNGIDLIDFGTWRTRHDDEQWQKYLVEMLRSKGAEHKHVLAVEREVGCCRVRPEEVAGACLENDLPASFEDCIQNGTHIKGVIEARLSRK